MIPTFAPKPSRYPMLQRGRLLARTPTSAALVIVRATKGMGKTTAGRELLARASTVGVTYEIPVTQSGLAAWRESIETLAAAAEPTTVFVDDIERNRDPAFGEAVLTLLETYPELHFIVAGTYVHKLDERSAKLRVPVYILTDEDLRFTSHEVVELVHLRIPEADDALGGRLYNLTRGWPVAVHDALSTAARMQPAVVSEARIDQFCMDTLSRVMPYFETEHKAALMLAGIFEDLTPRLVASALDLELPHATRVLSRLAEYLLQQRIDESGARRFRLHPAMRRVLWLTRRQLALPHELTTWTARLQESGVGLSEDVIWADTYAAFDARDWGKLDSLLLRNFSEEFLAVNTLLQAQLQSIPEEAQRRYPILRLIVLLEEFAFPRGRRGGVFVELREIATRAVNDESQMVGMLGVLATGMRLSTSRITGDEDTMIRMMSQIRDQYERLPATERREARTMVLTSYGQLAVSAWYLDRFDQADAWCAEGINLGASALAIGNVHLTSVAAAIAAWRGDIPEARRRIERCDSIGFHERWANHFVAVGYWIARSIVALEDRDFAGARAAYEHISWRQATNEHWPFMVWIKTHLLEEELGGEHALAWLDGQIEAHRHKFVLMRGPRRALDDLRARLSWRHGRHQLLPTRHSTTGLTEVYAKFVDGDFAAARTIATATVEAAARQGNLRLEASALLLRVVAEHERSDPAEQDTRHRALGMLERYGLSTPLRERAPWWDTQVPVQALPTPSRAAGKVSPAELRALRAVARYGTTPAAATRLHLSVHTVRDQMKSVYRKLGVRTREEALHVAATTGLLGAEMSH